MISTLTFCLYLASAYLIYSKDSQASDSITSQRWFSLSPALLAIVLHAILINSAIFQASGFNLSIISSASLISLMVSIQIIFASIKRPLQTLGLVMFPISGLSALSITFLEHENLITHPISSGVQSHIIISIIAYSLLMLATLQALALLFQHQALKKHHAVGLIRKLPPLNDMESLLFQILSFGFILLSASLLSGFLFFDDLFAQHLVHKTALSIIGWFLFGILLVGHHLFGWRGKQATFWTITSFIFILLAYFGSKFVLEIILK